MHAPFNLRSGRNQKKRRLRTVYIFFKRRQHSIMKQTSFSQRISPFSHVNFVFTPFIFKALSTPGNLSSQYHRVLFANANAQALIKLLQTKLEKVFHIPFFLGSLQFPIPWTERCPSVNINKYKTSICCIHT